MSVTAGPWPGRIRLGLSSASLRIERRFSAGSGVKFVGRLREPGSAGGVADVADHVAADRHPVGVAEEDHLAAGVPGGVDDAEAGDLVALAQHAVDLVRRALPRSRVMSRLTGLLGAASCTGRRPSIASTSSAWQASGIAARLADGLGDALVVGVDVGQRQHRDLAALDLGKIRRRSQLRPASIRTSLGEVDVDQRAPGTRLRRQTPGGEVLHGGRCRSCRAGRRCARRGPRAAAILLSPSTRAGWPAGSGSIRRRMRLRTCSAKWGVEAPARARMSSAVTSAARRRAGRGSRPRSFVRRRSSPVRPARRSPPAGSRRSPPGLRSPTRGCRRRGSGRSCSRA